MKKLFRDDLELLEDKVIIKPNSVIRHGIISPVDLHIGAGSVIWYNVICKKNVFVESATVYGDLLAKGDISISSSAVIKGKLVAGGSCSIKGEVKAKEILVDGNIFVTHATADRIEANGDLILAGRIKVKKLAAGGRIAKSHSS